MSEIVYCHNCGKVILDAPTDSSCVYFCDALCWLDFHEAEAEKGGERCLESS